MGVIQNSSTAYIDGTPSAVFSRNPQQDADEGWSITTRPYRPESESEWKTLAPEFLCTSGQNTCFLPGNLVLMGDGTRKAIEHIEVGDVVMTMQGPSRVRLIEAPLLGMSRKVIELRGLGDECLVISDEHPLWVRRDDARGRVECWGTYNLNHLMYEMRNSIEPKLPSMPIPLHIDAPEQIAHETGWVHVQPIYHHLTPTTQLHNIATDSGCAVFVEGFAAFSHCLTSLIPKGNWAGLKSDGRYESFLSQLQSHAVY